MSLMIPPPLTEPALTAERFAITLMLDEWEALRAANPSGDELALFSQWFADMMRQSPVPGAVLPRYLRAALYDLARAR